LGVKSEKHVSSVPPAHAAAAAKAVWVELYPGTVVSDGISSHASVDAFFLNNKGRVSSFITLV